MTTTYTLRSLTAKIREYERTLAPGSETSLWGDYCEGMRRLTGVSVTSLGEGRWTILNTASMVNLGTYRGIDPDSALDAMAEDAGYADFADMLARVPGSSRDEMSVLDAGETAIPDELADEWIDLYEAM